MAKLVAKVQNFRVFLTDNKVTPYTIKQRYFSMVDCGWHEKTVEKYADLKSCVFYLADNIVERR